MPGTLGMDQGELPHWDRPADRLACGTVVKGWALALAIVDVHQGVEDPYYYWSTDHRRVEGRGTSPYPWQRASLNLSSKST